MNKKKIRNDIKLGKWCSSNLLHSLLLLQTSKNTPDSLTDFLVGLSLLPKDSLFSKESLKDVFKTRFPRLFIRTTYNKKVIMPFDFYFEHLQNNFFTTRSILVKNKHNNLFKVTNIQSLIITTPHLSLYKIFIDDSVIESYKGNISNLVKDCSWQAIEKISFLTDSKAIFNYKIIKAIFGLNRNDVKKYVKNSEYGRVEYVYRHLGKEECRDMELPSNILGFKKYHKIIKGFKIILSGFESEVKFKISFSETSLFTIKHRLEKGQFRFSKVNFFLLASSASRPKLGKSEWVFNEQYERLGFSCVSNNHAVYRLKKYIESVNLGAYKQINNIYKFLQQNYKAEREFGLSTFKNAYNQLVDTFVWQN